MMTGHGDSRGLRPAGIAGVALLAAALLSLTVFGGGSALYPIPRLIGEAVALPLLAVALWRLPIAETWRSDRLACGLLIGMVGLILLQLVSLPAGLWSSLPGRELAVTGDQLMFGALPARPLSLDPEASVRAALMLLPAIGLYLYGRTAAPPTRLLVAAGLVGCALVSLVLGLIQLVSGQAAATHIYHDAQSIFSTGVFANRNHQAALMAVAIPLLAACLTDTPLARRFPLRSRLFAFGCGAGLFAVGALITASRTGSALLVPAILGGAAIVGEVRIGQRRQLLRGGAIVVASVLVLAVVLSQGGGPLAALAERSLGGDDPRLRFWPQVVVVLRQYLPIGSGFGTFRAVYDAAEPLALTGTLYINHAHDDWMELVLEGGLPALALLLTFLVWLAMATVRAWHTAENAADTALPRAGSIVVICLLLHSIVDYPLRTVALSTVFGFSLAMLSPAAPGLLRRAAWMRRILIGGAVLAVGWFTLMSNLGAVLARSDRPQVALGFTMARGLPNAIYALELAERGERDETVTYPAARAIRSSPVHWQAFRAAELAMSNPALQLRLEAQTLSWTRRDPTTLLAAYQRRLSTGDMSGAADAADAYLRLPDASERVVSSVVRQLRDPRFARVFVPHLAQRPVWRGRLMSLLSADPIDAVGNVRLWQQLAAGGAPVGREEAVALLSRYATSGNIGRLLGYRLWLAAYAPGHDPAALAVETPLRPYDWSIASGMEDRIGLLGGRVDIDMPSGTVQPILQKVVALPAGTYRLAAVFEGLGAAGLGWSISCEGAASTPQSIGQPIAVDTACPVQLLTLFSSGGTGTVTGLHLTRVT